ncbi:hypothetical protein ACIRD3_08850 [Kitasatospora sp. NPDC093550]|uniref:hypothetical protein n=1 Tax=Kitasatospora sp. NPDC093550 TaxID=3364089 RepID=UPI0037FDD831
MAQQRPFGPPVPWTLRLLLLAALLFGVLTMHTLGHPVGGHGGHGDPGPSVVAAPHVPEHPAMAAEPVGVAPVPAEPAVAEPALAAPVAVEAVRAAAADPASAGGMDPMAVCLAVLAGWTLVLLVVGPLLRRSGDAAAGVRARLLRAVRALPPPGGGRILLTRLSVLRQ